MATIARKDKKDNKGLVINTLVVRKLNRSAIDVGQWRTALKAADNDRRQKLYDLYEDILLDPVLSTSIEKRINAITNAELRFMKDEKPLPEMEDLIDSPVFEELLTEIMNARFWGKSVIELDFSSGLLQVYNIPRQHIYVQKGLIVINPGDEVGIPYRGDDFFLEAGKDKEFGQILRAAPYVIYKRGDFGDWAEFAELFGMPFKKGSYSAQDDKSRELLEEALELSGGKSWIVHPKETDIELVESKTSGNGVLYDLLRKACNEEILISILGQTMTTINGSSKSQSETHKEVEESINKADRRFVQRILNTELLPRLEKRGYPVNGGWFTFIEAGESLSMMDMMEIHTKFKNDLKLEIDDDFLYDTYGIPRPEGVQKKASTTKPDDVPAGKKVQDKKMSDDEQSFWTKLKEGLESFFVSAPREGASALEDGDHHIHYDLVDLPGFNIEGLAKRVATGEDYFDPDLFYYTSDQLLKAIHAGFSEQNFADIGIEYGYTPDAFKTAMEMNLFRFSAAKTLAEVQKLNEAFRGSKGWYDFLTKARDISGEFNETWLQTEYNTAYLTAESSAAYYRLLAQQDIFPYWQYITINDAKVRLEHRKLHNLVLACTDKLWEKIYPPNGWNCRCRVKPLMKHEAAGIDLKLERKKVDEYFETDEWKSAKAQGWGVNRALTAEVFQANQMYIRKFPNRAASYLDKLTAEKWGCSTVPKLKAAAKTTMPVTENSAEAIWNAESSEGIIRLKNYDGRSLELSKKTFSHHTTKSSNRIALWDGLKEALLDPDEVFLNNYHSRLYDNYVLVKYYRDKVIIANCRVENNKLALKTWYEMQTTQPSNKKIDLNKLWQMHRHGLLIKKPDR